MNCFEFKLVLKKLRCLEQPIITDHILSTYINVLKLYSYKNIMLDLVHCMVHVNCDPDNIQRHIVTSQEKSLALLGIEL
jgi:hypothetical protein